MLTRTSVRHFVSSWNAAMRMASTQNVPAGHHNSDLTAPACNIGLNRLRDITLRQDITVTFDSKQVSLETVFKNKCSIVVGLPDLTPTQHAHISGYVSAAKQLQSAGYEQIVIAAVAPPEQLDEFLSSTGAQSEGCITGLADSSGRFTRMLGLDINAPGTELPFSQRYLGIVKDGILTRLCVEKSPEVVEVSSSAQAIQTVQAMNFAA